MTNTLVALATAMALGVGLAPPVFAQDAQPGAATEGQRDVSKRPEVGPKGTTYQLTIPKQGKMIADAVFYCWMPDSVGTVRCVIVHLHGCTREGDAEHMVNDLQWKALAKKWNAVFVAPRFTTGTNQTCVNWYNPDNGSARVFLEMLDDLSRRAAHPEIKTAPWALWGHSGGSIWITAMTGKYPERVAAAVAQSAATEISNIDAALKVPILHHNGRQDVAHNDTLFLNGRKKGAIWAHAINPDTQSNMDGHQCHDLRFLAIPWLDACLAMRLPQPGQSKLRDIDASSAWLGDKTTKAIAPAASFAGDKLEACWFPNRTLAEKWVEYMEKGTITDTTPPPAPYGLSGSYANRRMTLNWNAEADLESGIKTFIIYRNGSLMQILRYSNVTKYSSTMGYQRWNDGDHPSPSPAPEMTFTDTDVDDAGTYVYEVSCINWSDVTGPRSAPLTLRRGQVTAGKSP